MKLLSSKCIEYQDIQILVVNDGSKDITQELAEAYEKKYPACARSTLKDAGGHGSTIKIWNEICGGNMLRL